MLSNLLPKVTMGKRNRTVRYDRHGNPYPTNLKKHLVRAARMERGLPPDPVLPIERIAAGAAALGALYLTYQIGLPLLIGGVR